MKTKFDEDPQVTLDRLERINPSDGVIRKYPNGEIFVSARRRKRLRVEIARAKAAHLRVTEEYEDITMRPMLPAIFKKW